MINLHLPVRFAPSVAFSGNARRQRGVSLLLVLLVLVLVGLTAMTASKSALFNESITGNEADYARAAAAAEALIRDAQLDIAGITPAGLPCNPAAGFSTCRINPGELPTLAIPYFPQDVQDAIALRDALANACVQGICAPQTWPGNALPDNFWMTPATLAANTANAAGYGQFTGAAPGATGNPILTAVPRQAWYWVEMIEFATGFCAESGIAAANLCVNRPDVTKPYVYRITAVAQGNRPNTIAVIQTFYVPFPPIP